MAYYVVDTGFNKAHYPDLIGKLFDEPPGFAQVEPTSERPCPCGSHLPSWWEYDARGIELARVCVTCEKEKLSHYRPDVLTDANYWADEPIEAEDY